MYIIESKFGVGGRAVVVFGQKVRSDQSQYYRGCSTITVFTTSRDNLEIQDTAHHLTVTQMNTDGKTWGGKGGEQ